MNAAAQLKKALDEQALAYQRQCANEARKQGEYRAKICKIKNSYPDKPGMVADWETQRLRALAWLVESDELNADDAYCLGIREERRDWHATPEWNLEILGQKLIDEGLPVRIETDPHGKVRFVRNES